MVKRMDEADLVINLGCLKTDMNFGNRPPHIIQDRTVWAVDRKVDVKHHTYTDVGVRDFTRALLKQDLKTHREKVEYADNLPKENSRNGRQIKVADILRTVNDFLAAHKGLSGGGGVGRHAVRRPRHPGAERRDLSGAGILCLDGICGAGGDGRANRLRLTTDRAMRVTARFR